MCGVQGKKKGAKKKATKNNKIASKRKAGFGHAGGDLASKIFALMEKHKEVCSILIRI